MSYNLASPFVGEHFHSNHIDHGNGRVSTRLKNRKTKVDKYDQLIS